MTENKYPNADTSPERLARIENTFNFDGALYHEEKRSRPIIRDLLAMLQERDSTIAYDRQILYTTEDRLRDLRQQLTAAIDAEATLVAQLSECREELAEIHERAKDNKFR